MKLFLLALLAIPAIAQIRAGCTPNSVTVAMAEKMNVAGVWEWNCYAQNIGTTTETLSMVGFALDFIELEQVNQGDTIAIFEQKQASSGWAKAANIAGWAAAGAMLVLGQGYLVIPARGLADIGLAAYGSTKLQPLFTAQEPSIANAIAGMLTSDQVLAAGAGFEWKVYASNTGSPIGPTQLAVAKNAGKKVKPSLPALGPRILIAPQKASAITAPPPATTPALPPLPPSKPKPTIYEGPTRPAHDVVVIGWEVDTPASDGWQVASVR